MSTEGSVARGVGEHEVVSEVRVAHPGNEVIDDTGLLQWPLAVEARITLNRLEDRLIPSEGRSRASEEELVEIRPFADRLPVRWQPSLQLRHPDPGDPKRGHALVTLQPRYVWVNAAFILDSNGAFSEAEDRATFEAMVRAFPEALRATKPCQTYFCIGYDMLR